jgi:hypothetical protein
MENCTDIIILKPTHYGPMTILEDPDYDPCVHSRTDFNAKDYYVRRLNPSEMLAQGCLGMLYEIMQDIQLSCVYNGRTETVTCPASCILNDDSLKTIFKIENCGLAWIFHDWLYYSHAFDVRADGGHTQIAYQGIVHGLIDTIIKMGEYTPFVRRLDTFAVEQLNAKWNYFLLD